MAFIKSIWEKVGKSNLVCIPDKESNWLVPNVLGEDLGIQGYAMLGGYSTKINL
jgi:hypothetical protein